MIILLATLSPQYSPYVFIPFFSVISAKLVQGSTATDAFLEKCFINIPLLDPISNGLEHLNLSCKEI